MSTRVTGNAGRRDERHVLAAHGRAVAATALIRPNRPAADRRRHRVTDLVPARRIADHANAIAVTVARHIA
ncbi:hypothetical protein, partial [Streptomyces sp. NPDC058664]|uniref:hypothetical protein n=1 Tax=Streptomyces sp. NPDC058664 TaxID=3346585 RepID=UPI0036626037